MSYIEQEQAYRCGEELEWEQHHSKSRRKVKSTSAWNYNGLLQHHPPSQFDGTRSGHFFKVILPTNKPTNRHGWKHGGGNECIMSRAAAEISHKVEEQRKKLFLDLNHSFDISWFCYVNVPLLRFLLYSSDRCQTGVRPVSQAQCQQAQCQQARGNQDFTAPAPEWSGSLRWSSCLSRFRAAAALDELLATPLDLLFWPAHFHLSTGCDVMCH